MFELTPTRRGWCLDGGDRRGHWFADREVAIEAAERGAELRHRLRGYPTGVRMQVVDEWVLLARFG